MYESKVPSVKITPSKDEVSKTESREEKKLIIHTSHTYTTTYINIDIDISKCI